MLVYETTRSMTRPARMIVVVVVVMALNLRVVAQDDQDNEDVPHYGVDVVRLVAI